MMARRDPLSGLHSSTVMLAAFLLLTSIANAAVLGIDFGTSNIKAVLVKPGIPFEIVLSKDSKRKEIAAVAFKPARDGKNNILAEAGSFPERLYGADAIALQGRFPGEVFPNLKFLLQDVNIDGVPETYTTRYPAIQLSSTDGGTTLKSGAFVEGEALWSVEELLAMELANIRRNAESLAGKGSSVHDVVISIPAFYTATEKAAISRAAELAGMNVMSLITDGLAVGLDYAKSRTFPSISEGKKPEHHIVFDMGAGSTTATVLRFQSRSVKDVGRFNKTVQEVAVAGVGWDRQLGGDALTQHILTDFIYKFMTKPVIKSRGIEITEVQSNARLMSRLVKEADKARTVLSANTETSSSFEELLPDIDFKTKLTRVEFEQLIAEDVARVTAPIKTALKQADLTVADIDSIILYGGAVRTPAVQRSLEDLAGSQAKLKSNVNADESAAFGAALKAASLSPSFKVKEIRTSDVSGYISQLVFTADNGKDRAQDIFLPNSPVGNNGTTKQVPIKQTSDFDFYLHQSGVPMAKIMTQNLTQSVKELHDKFGCEKNVVNTKLNVRLSPVDGLPEVTGGAVSCETDRSAKSNVGDSVKDWFGLGKKKGQEPLGNDEDDAGSTAQVTSSAKSSASSSASASASTSKTPEKPKKRIETINIAVKTIRLHQPLAEEVERMKGRLADFDRSDKRRLAREEAMNVLESYTYYVRDFLSNADYSTFSTEAQRATLSKLLDSTKEFMEEQGQLAKTTEKMFKEKLFDLRDLVQPILDRRTESELRPEKILDLKSALQRSDSTIKMIREQIAKAGDAVKASASAASSSVSGAVSDGLDDLEESEKDGLPAEVEMSSPYTEDDLTSIQDVYNQVSKWLTGKESEQKKLKAFEEPAFLVNDIDTHLKMLTEATKHMMLKKIKARSTSSSRRSSSKTSAPSKKSTNTDTKSSMTGAPEAGESGKPQFVKLGEGDDMLSEDEILRMVSQAKDGIDPETSTRDEL